MFNVENTVEQMVLDMLSGGVTSNRVAEAIASYGGACYRNQGGLLHGI
jgi:type I restriction enzyme, R subunit